MAQLIYTVTAVILTYVVGLAIRRTLLSPIASIPGPLLARLTYWYEFYYDVILVGQYAFQIQELHKRYGPIIRINPHEVHIDDPDFYDELYVSGASGKKRNKWTWFVDSFGIYEAVFSTVDHDLHRMRRAAVNPFFSKAKIRALQDRIEHVIEKLLTRFRQFQESSEPMPVGLAFTAITNDIVSSYAFDQRELRVDAPDFAPDFHIASEKAAKQSHFMKQFPWLLTLSQKLPDAWLMSMDPDLAEYIRLQQFLQRKTAEIQKNYHSPEYKTPERTTIFHEILNASNLPESQKSHSRLWQDGQTLLVAGTITTAATFSTLFYFLLSNAEMLQSLRTELFEALPDRNAPVDLVTLEALPYLTACIKEALRFSNGVSTRLQRIDPDKNMTFHAKQTGLGSPATKDTTYVLPPGTPMSMTTMLIHYNPKIYPEPFEFRPSRWLIADEETGRLSIAAPQKDKYFLPFSKGTRGCLGINLAWAELYLLLAMVFRRYGSKDVRLVADDGYLELFDTTFEQDIEIVGDGVTPIVREPLKGVKVKVRAPDAQ